MKSGQINLISINLFLILNLSCILGYSHPIQEFYKNHKNDVGMEARIVPPKAASLLIDEDYPEAIDLLKSLTTLKYLNFEGKEATVTQYAKEAISAKGNYTELLEEQNERRVVSVFGMKKKGTVRKVMAIVKMKTQFILLIAKGKLNSKQIATIPALAKEI